LASFMPAVWPIWREVDSTRQPPFFLEPEEY